jgi:hypothetical protein
MARGLAAAHQPGSRPFASQWQAIFQYPWPLLSHLAKLQGRELRRGTTGGAGAISRAIAIGGLILVLAGCGIAQTFPVANPSAVTRITLSPLANVGFTTDRTAFCPQTSPNPAPLHSTNFCPNLTASPGSPTITQAPQGALNQLLSALIRGTRLSLPNIGAGPEPPVQFTVHVQGLVHVVDTTGLVEHMALHVNLNDDLKTEVQPVNPTASLGRLFANDLVAVDANASGTDVGTFDAADPLEIRGAGVASGQLASGNLGFNVPSLLGVGDHAPYLHNGEARTLAAVFPLHQLGTGTIATTLTAQQQADLIVFLNSIDGRTDTFRSQGDDFRDALALP